MKLWKKIYTIAKFVFSIFVVGISIFVDLKLLSNGDGILLLLFIPLEILIIVYTIVLFRYVDKTVLTAEYKNGSVSIETLGRNYKIPISKVTVIKGKLNYYILKFGNNSLRVYRSNRGVNEFISKYFKRI